MCLITFIICLFFRGGYGVAIFGECVVIGSPFGIVSLSGNVNQSGNDWGQTPCWLQHCLIWTFAGSWL